MEEIKFYQKLEKTIQLSPSALAYAKKHPVRKRSNEGVGRAEAGSYRHSFAGQRNKYLCHTRRTVF